MFTSFSTALSALDANSTALGVVGNNLANVDTPGYKASVVYFRDLVTRSMETGLGETQVGLGTAQPTAIRQFTQGAIQASSGPLDAAIQGDGFFVVKNDANQTMYTRAGNFKTDASGVLLTATGERVQGWHVDPATGKMDTTVDPADIVVPIGSVKQPIATKGFTLDLNLNSSAAVSGSPDLSYPITVYDQLGGSHVLTANFTKTGDNTWHYAVNVPDGDVDGTAASSSTGTSGDLTFTDSGQLVPPASGKAISFNIGPLKGTNPPLTQTLVWNLVNKDGSQSLTQVAATSAVSAGAQDGSPSAQLVNVSLADGGLIVARFSDDQQTVVGQLAMASIRNPDTLAAQGNNNFSVSATTASPVVGLPGSGGRGKIVGASTEASTVDIATEFTNLIVYQRAYQASSKVVTTADQLSQDTINLIR